MKTDIQLTGGAAGPGSRAARFGAVLARWRRGGRLRGRVTRWELLAYAILALAVGAAAILSSWGQVVLDTSSKLYFAPGRTLGTALSSWNPNPTLGQGNYGSGIAPLAAAIWLIRAVVPSLWLAIRVWRLLLILVAGLGALLLLDRMTERRSTPVGRVAVATLYMVNPYVIVAGSTDPILLPYALLPWLLLTLDATVHAPRSWRGPAAFGIVFFCMSGVNAGVVPLFMLLAVPCYLVYVRLVERASYLRLALALLRCLLPAALVSLYWLIPSVLAARTGVNVAYFTEKPADVARTSSYAESLRLLGFWLMYGRTGARLWMPSFVGYLTNPLIVLGSFALPAAAAVSAAVSRARARAFAVLLLAVGVPVMVGMFPPDRPTPFGRLLAKAFASVPGAIAFRTTNKAGALVALALALLLALGVEEAARRLSRRGRVARVLAPVAAVAVLAAAVLPGWTDGLYPIHFKLPRYWQQAAADLDNHAKGTRVLLLPDEANGVYRWADFGPEDLSEALLARSAAVRVTALVGASPAQANFLAALHVPLDSGHAIPGAIAPMARYLGAADVLVRNDLAWEDAGGVHPSTLASELAQEPGLNPLGAYGKPGLNTVAFLPLGTEYGVDPRAPQWDALLPPLQYYTVDRPRALLRAEPAAGTVLVDGDNFAVPTMAQAQMLRGEPTYQLLGAMSTDDLTRALDDGTRIVLTDTNRRRIWTPSRVGASFTPTLTADDPIRPSDPTLSLFGSPDAQSVVELHGAKRISATSVGSVFSYLPYGKPADAFDGDPSTAWMVGDLGTAVGQSVTIQLDQPRVISQIDLQPADTLPLRITRVRVTVGDRTREVRIPDRPGLLHVPVPFGPTMAGSVKVEIAAVSGVGGINPVGFSEITIPGVHVQEVVRLPVRFRQLVEQLDLQNRERLAVTPLDVLLKRQGQAHESYQDEERALDRDFWTPDTRQFTLSGRIARGVNLPEPIADKLIGVPDDIVATSSSHWFGAVGTRAYAAVDGSPTTAWIPASRQAGEWIDLKLPAQQVDHIVIRQDVPIGLTGVAYASAGTVSIDGGRPLKVKLGPGASRIDFPKRSVHEVRLTITRTDGFGDQVRISEIQVGAEHGPLFQLWQQLRGCTQIGTLDGQPVMARLTGTMVQLDDQASTLPFAACNKKPLALAPGAHQFRSAPGWLIEHVRLSSAPVGGPELPATPPAPPSGRVLSDSRTGAAIRTSAATAPYYLVLGQGYDPRWQATMDGKPLGKPLLLDGYSVGWRIDNLSPHRFTVGYQPQQAARVTQLVSLFALLVAAALALFGRRRLQ